MFILSQIGGQFALFRKCRAVIEAAEAEPKKPHKIGASGVRAAKTLFMMDG